MPASFHAQKGPFVSELSADGERFRGFYLIRQLQLEPFRDATRGKFLSLVLSDRSGQIQGRVWENAETLAAGLQRGQVVKVEGDIETYNDRLQMRILRLRAAEDSEYDRRDMVPSSERDPEMLLAELDDFRGAIENPHLRSLVNSFYDDSNFRSRLQVAPAAVQFHHAYLGGLLEHIVDMLRLARAVQEIYPQIDKDLLSAGVLLVQIGKIDEFTWDTDISLTDEGRLVGHLFRTNELVSQAISQIPEFPADLSMRLRHVLVSHRGRREWGSPLAPQTLEAIALHHIESLSAQVNRFLTLLENRPGGEPWTAYDRLLRRQLYAGPDEDGSYEAE